MLTSVLHLLRTGSGAGWKRLVRMRLLLSTLTWDGLIAPRGLAALNGSLFIADSTRVLGVGSGSRQWR